MSGGWKDRFPEINSRVLWKRSPKTAGFSKSMNRRGEGMEGKYFLVLGRPARYDMGLNDVNAERQRNWELRKAKHLNVNR